jgi:hypothetical protein
MGLGLGLGGLRPMAAAAGKDKSGTWDRSSSGGYSL